MKDRLLQRSRMVQPLTIDQVPSTYDYFGNKVRCGVKHELKVWPKQYFALTNGFKSFEVRKNDRDFHVGDLLILKEWNPDREEFTGDMCTRMINYLLKGGQFGIEEEYVVLGLLKW